MRALEQWSFDEACEAHEVLDALDRVEAQAHKDAIKPKEGEGQPRRRGRRESF